MPPLPPNVINYIGLGVVILMGLVISTAVQEWTKKKFRNGSGDRRGGDSQIFDKMKQLHEELLHQLRLQSEHSEKINHSLQKIMEDNFDRHQSVLEEIAKIPRVISPR